ncbi:hypothetical protein [Marinomonas sp. TW1]|uniref:hypothetical protein n=1 Tax=Marinomonas sp. TW1 TaxID=1561203 RepID=UPI0007AFBF59|nr:hypothetical protein [Marinomonas sp. TW1]KZN15286.1 hypothetical protein OA79_00385 [Marinomonas sp. TW1]
MDQNNHIDFEGQEHQQMMYFFMHEDHGELKIIRNTKERDNREIYFTVELSTLEEEEKKKKKKKTNIRTTVTVIIENESELVWENRLISVSSIGYGDINLPESMQGKRVIYLLHHVFALTGLELGVQVFEVRSIVNEALNHICPQCGMKCSNASSWAGQCDDLQRRSLKKAQSHGWCLKSISNDMY